MNAEHPFQAGVDVALVTRSKVLVAFSIVKIGKVYRTGRFILEGETHQWTPSLNAAGEWIATDGGTSRVNIEMVSDRLLAEVATSDRLSQFRRIQGDLARIDASVGSPLARRLTDQHIADLSGIVAELTAQDFGGAQ